MSVSVGWVLLPYILKKFDEERFLIDSFFKTEDLHSGILFCYYNFLFKRVGSLRK